MFSVSKAEYTSSMGLTLAVACDGGGGGGGGNRLPV